MTKTQYQRVKKLINKLEDEVLANGEDITSPEFDLVVRDLLAQRGFTYTEYLENDEPKPQEDKPEEIELKIV